MAIAVYSFTIVVPLGSVQRGFPRGVLGWLAEAGAALGKSAWLDDRLAAMCYYDPGQAGDALQSWIRRGFATRLAGADPAKALLVAQVDMTLGVISESDWLEFDADHPCVWLRGEPRGPIAQPAWLDEKLPYRR